MWNPHLARAHWSRAPPTLQLSAALWLIVSCVCARARAYGDVACWTCGLRRRLVNERMRVSSDSELRFYSHVVL